MPRKTIKDLETEITLLQSRLIWQENLNKRLVVMLEDARDHFDAVGQNIEALLPIVHQARDVYAKVVIDVTEAIGAQNDGLTR